MFLKFVVMLLQSFQSVISLHYLVYFIAEFLKKNYTDNYIYKPVHITTCILNIKF